MWNKLQNFLQDFPNLAIAFSGGLDSRFLTYAAKKVGCKVLLLHANGVHIPKHESAYAKTWAKEQGLDLKLIEVNVLSNENVQINSKQRCYYCKKHLLKLFKDIARGIPLCDGTNADDTKSYRPGLQALKEENIMSPLAECGLNKKSIRDLAKQEGLDNYNQKARPCLLTRFAYDLKIEPQVLDRVAKAELELEQQGLEDFRLRICPEPILQSTTHGLCAQKIENILQKHGFYGVKQQISDEISGFFDVKKILN